MSELRQQIDEAVKSIHAECALQPRVGIILGTGLNRLAERIEMEARLRYDRIPHFAVSTVESHDGEL
ncbi:MAG TPA: purine-nucleoside phosphorylase, partial [Candidatus Hydrogenedentes bacterium]|nr:purine-nucleoside phosphorylase [Candidatus Hydrogenedentota bacterium]